LTIVPELPAVAETVPGYEAGSWYAVMAPAATPRAIVERLNKDSATALKTPDVNTRLTSAGVDPEILSPEQLGAKIASETARWGKVVKAAGIKAQ
jgi:tripartite-type tricarboxylate transporter receptor subunit TctC